MPRISKYPPVVAPQDENELLVNQDGVTKKITVELLMTKAPGSVGEERITALEDKYVKTSWFESIDSGTSGTLAPPEGGTILLDQWAAGVDALVSTESGGVPTFESPRTADGDIVTASLDASGNWSFSGAPSAYPVDLIFAYEVKFKDFDRGKSLGEIEIMPSAKGINTDTSGFSGLLTAAEKDVHLALNRIDSEAVGHSLALAESDFLVAEGSPLKWVRKTIDQVKTLLGVASSLPVPSQADDVLMGGGSPLDWVKKSIGELKTALGLGSAAYTDTTQYDASGAASGAVAGHEADYDHEDIPDPPAAENDFVVAGGSPLCWTRKTAAQVGEILGISPLSPNISTDHTANGLVFAAEAGESLAFGNLCYLKSDGKYWKADADAALTMPCVVMALESISADAAGTFLKTGFVRDDSWSWAVGGMIYASTDPGGPTLTAPSGSGDQVQVVGYACSATVIFFDPNPVLIEVA